MKTNKDEFVIMNRESFKTKTSKMHLEITNIIDMLNDHYETLDEHTEIIDYDPREICFILFHNGTIKYAKKENDLYRYDDSNCVKDIIYTSEHEINKEFNPEYKEYLKYLELKAKYEG